MPKTWEGISLLSTFEREAVSPRDYVIGQWYDEFLGYIVPGRMYLDDRYKYTVYHDQEGIEEELYSRCEDPLEQTNLAAKPEYGAVLNGYREKLGQYLDKTKDPV